MVCACAETAHLQVSPGPEMISSFPMTSVALATVGIADAVDSLSQLWSCSLPLPMRTAAMINVNSCVFEEVGYALADIRCTAPLKQPRVLIWGHHTDRRRKPTIPRGRLSPQDLSWQGLPDSDR